MATRHCEGTRTKEVIARIGRGITEADVFRSVSRIDVDVVIGAFLEIKGISDVVG